MPCRLKALGICAKGFWVTADIHEVRWNEGYPICKISVVNMYSELKACILTPLEGNNKAHKTNTDTHRQIISHN